MQWNAQESAAVRVHLKALDRSCRTYNAAVMRLELYLGAASQYEI